MNDTPYTPEIENEQTPELPGSDPRDFRNLFNKDGFYTSIYLIGAEANTIGTYGLFFIAKQPCIVEWVGERHGTAGTHGAAVTLDLIKVPSGTAPASGTSVLASTFDLKATNDTVYTKMNKDLAINRRLAANDALFIKFSGTRTSLEDLLLEVYLKPLLKGHYS